LVCSIQKYNPFLREQKIKYAMANPTTTKRKKRAYKKKRLQTQDELWKAVIVTLWSPFLHFCMEDWVDKIDFTRKPDFLDKELKKLMLRSKSKNRAVDVLMRIYLKDGSTKCFLFHVEVQGYKDPQFEYRVYEYYYRTGDLLQEPVETLVIMIDDDPEYRPTEYRRIFGQTELIFRFRLFKLLDNPPSSYTSKADNPFSVVFETAWYGLKKNMLKNDADLEVLKYRLIKRLIENNTDRVTIYALLEFINVYLPFANSEKELTFEREIESFIDNDNDMETLTIRQIYDRKIREDGDKRYKKELKLRQKTEMLLQEEARMRQEEARARQEEAQARQEEARARQEKLAAIVLKLHKQGVSDESIADTLLEPLSMIKAIIRHNTPSV
jgi:hypothetical protein